MTPKSSSDQEEVIWLSPEGWQEFQELLSNPPPLNERLKRAFAESARILVAKLRKPAS